MVLDIFRVSVVFQICIATIAAYDQYERGWIPIPNEEIYRRLRIEVQKPMNFEYIDSSSKKDTKPRTEDKEKNNVIQLIKPQQIFDGFKVSKMEVLNVKYENPSSANDLCDKTGSTICTKSSNNEDKEYEDSKFKIIPSETSAREAKMVTSRSKEKEQTDTTNIGEEGAGNKFQNKGALNNVWKRYEVTEGEEYVDGFNLEPKQITVSESKKLKEKDHLSNNLMKKIKDVYDKYGIGYKQDSWNYEKSRIVRGRTPVTTPEFVFVPVPVDYVKRYSHFKLIDPLLSFFLLNNGYYLPNVYTLNNNYRNLYGLVLNHLHNNQLYASYKTFSDTDSSN